MNLKFNTREGTGQTMPVVHQKQLLTSEEAAAFLQISMAKLYKLTSSGGIPCYAPTGGKLYFRQSELEEWVWSNRKATNAEIDQLSKNYLLKIKNKQS